ncbi:hypothetical protein GCM10023238_38280 [Streptomyces heliomycini]
MLLTAAGDRAFCVGQDLKEHIGLLIEDRETGSGQTMSTVCEHYNPIVKAIAGAAKPVVAAVKRGRGGGRLRLRAGRGLPDRRGHGGVQHLVRRGRADRGLRDLLDAAARGRPRARHRPAALPAQRLRAEAYELASPTGWSRGGAARGGGEGGAGAGRGPDGGVRGAEGVRGVRAEPLAGGRPWRGGRAQTRAGSSETTAIAVRAES